MKQMTIPAVRKELRAINPNARKEDIDYLADRIVQYDRELGSAAITVTDGSRSLPRL